MMPGNAPLAVHERQRFPLVRLVPIIAILAACRLGYHALSQRGPLVTLTLQSAEGVEPSKTKIRHKQVELGVVEDLVPSTDLSRVTIHIRTNRYADGHLTTSTCFWVVRPQLSAVGISGLVTLIPGSYIEMEPGPGDALLLKPMRIEWRPTS
jgi:paraquat-inducible protein B